jgi:hypothetical protein
MCGDPPKPPSGSLPGGVPTGPTGGTGLCCACPANGDVNTDGFSNYFTTTYGTSDAVVNKCKIAILRTEEGGTVTITKSFSLAYTNGATEAGDKDKVKGAITGAFSAWQTAGASFRIQIEQPGCKPQKLSMIFTATFVASGADVAVTVDGTPAPPADQPDLRMSVSGGVRLEFFVNKRGNITWSMTHELGHSFGLEDEYIYSHPSSSPPTITIKGASDPDKTITLTAAGAGTPTTTFAFNNATVMGISQNTVFPDHLFYWVAIEVKKIMQAAGVSAVVKVVAP